MRKFDFTRPGGFPLTQDDLDWLQTAYTETVLALAAIGGAGPFIVSGIVPTTGWSISPGWIFYNNELLYFAGWSSGVPLPPFSPAPKEPCMTIVETDTPLTFNDGSTPSVKIIRQLSFGFAVPVAGTSFVFSTSMPNFVKENTFSQSNISHVGTGSAGTFLYKKDTLSNNLIVSATITVSNPSAITSTSANPPYYLMGAVLPVGYRPTRNVPFTCYVRYDGNLFKDDMGTDYIKSMNGELNATFGQLWVGLLKPDPSITSYQIYFNALIPLD